MIFKIFLLFILLVPFYANGQRYREFRLDDKFNIEAFYDFCLWQVLREPGDSTPKHVEFPYPKIWPTDTMVVFGKKILKPDKNLFKLGNTYLQVELLSHYARRIFQVRVNVFIFRKEIDFSLKKSVYSYNLTFELRRSKIIYFGYSTSQ